VTPVLVTLLTLLIQATLFLLADILVVYQLSLSRERDRTYLTFGSLGQNARLKYLPLKGSPNLTLEVLNGVSGSGNYKVLDVASHRVFVSRDVVFEEGQPSLSHQQM